jgi:putative transposase
MESFFHSLKSDAVHGVTFAHEGELAQRLQSDIPYYNSVRLHSGIGYSSSHPAAHRACYPDK